MVLPSQLDLMQIFFELLTVLRSRALLHHVSDLVAVIELRAGWGAISPIVACVPMGRRGTVWSNVMVLTLGFVSGAIPVALLIAGLLKASKNASAPLP